MKKFLLIAIIISFELCKSQILNPVSVATPSRRDMIVMISGTVKNRTIDTLTNFFYINAQLIDRRDVIVDSEREFGLVYYFNKESRSIGAIFQRDRNINTYFEFSTRGLLELELQAINLYPSSPFEVKKIDNSELMFDMTMDVISDSHSGPNCETPCDQYDRNEQFCDPIDARIRYMNLSRHGDKKCVINDCQNNAQCFEHVLGGKNCECLVGNCGNLCAETICSSECDPEGSFCDASGICTCYSGFEGNKCDQVTCNRYNLCLNGGTCAVENQAHVCNCDTERFAGKVCQLACINACVGGMCIDVGGSPVCFYDQIFSTPTLQPVTPPEKQIIDYLNLNALKIASIVLSIYTAVVLALLLLIKKYFTFFEYLKERIGAKDGQRDTNTIVGPAGAYKAYEVTGTIR